MSEKRIGIAAVRVSYTLDLVSYTVDLALAGVQDERSAAGKTSGQRRRRGGRMRNGRAIEILGGAAITGGILLVFVFITTVLGGSLLKFLGMEYESFWSVFLFFIIYYVVDFPIDLLVDALPRALRSIGKLKKDWQETLFYAALDIPINCIVMVAIDFFMDSVSMPFPAIVGFSAALCALNLFLSRKERAKPVRVFLWEQKEGCEVPSRTLLLESLELYCEEEALPMGPDKLKIETEAHGKPAAYTKAGEQWIPRNDLYFSVSHTERWWICAVHNAPIGADIEERGRRVKLKLADRFFTEEERSWLEKNGRTEDHLLELWVRKEAYVKYLGTGIAEGLQSFSVVKDGEYADEIGEGDKAAFCSVLFPEGMRDEDDYPVPLTGSFCTQRQPEGIEIGFLERAAAEQGEEGNGDAGGGAAEGAAEDGRKDSGRGTGQSLEMREKEEQE